MGLVLNVVVLHFQHWPGVRPTLDSVLEQLPSRATVQVIDNGSADGSAELIAAAYPTVSVTRVSENRGYGAGMNVGIELAGDIRAHLLLTHDCVLAPGALDTLLDRLEQDARLGAVGPLTCFLSKPNMVFSAGGTIDSRTHMPAHIGWREQVDNYQGREPYAVGWITGSCVLARGELFESVGRFDEEYFMYFEETDFFVRAVSEGWRVECVPAALAWQEPGPRPVALWTRNEIRFLKRNFGLRAAGRQLATDAARIGRNLVSRNPAGRTRARQIARGVSAIALRTPPKNLYQT